EPVPPERAQRLVERQRTHALSDQRTRERHGFTTSARREHEIEQVLTREDELASGHEELRFTGYVAVSAPSVDELELAAKEVQRPAPARAPGRRAGQRVHGGAAAGAGAAVTMPRLPAHRVTTAHMGAAYPFQAERGLSSRGVFIGRDVHSGGAFMADGWEWYV